MIGTIRKSSPLPTGMDGTTPETVTNKRAGEPTRAAVRRDAADLGIHCFYLSEWLSGLAVSGSARSAGDGPRAYLDVTNVLALHWRRARCVLASQIATGRRDGLTVNSWVTAAFVVVANEPHRLIVRR